MNVFSDPKPRTTRSKNYLAHVTRNGCFICRNPECEPHHVSFHDAAWGMKSGDLTTVAMCRKHHDMAHTGRLGREEIYEGVIMTMKTWIEKGGVL